MTRSLFAPGLAAQLLAALLTACANPAGPVVQPEATRAPGQAEATVALPAAPLAGLTVEVLDVGQGDSILLRTEGKAALIDAGTGHTGEAALPHLQARGLERLDLMVSTHPHADHIGGLDDVLRAMGVKLLLDNGLPHTTDAYRKLMADVEERGVAYKAAKAGQKIALGQAKLEVLHPGPTPLTGTRSDLNSNSVVLRLTYGGLCVLFTGDAEEPTEDALLERGLGRCDVLKVAHHGGEHSTQAAFLAAVQPQVALLSAGVGNDYGHPRAETLDRLRAAGTQVLRTDTQGTLTLTTDGRTATVTPERGSPVTVRARGSSSTGGPTGVAAHEPAASGRVNLNTATAEQLAALPGLGEKLAAAIVAHRKTHGPFGSVDELDHVSGIGPATLDKLRGLVTAP